MLPRRTRWTAVLAAGITIALGPAGCGSPASKATVLPPNGAPPAPSATTPPPPTAAASPTPAPAPTKKPSPKPKTTLKKTAPAGADTGPRPVTAPSDGVPATGAGTFTIAAGGTGVVGTGSTLVTYRVELEDGIAWGANPVWTANSFAGAA